MAVNIGPKIGIDGEAQFRKEITNILQQQKTLASELKAVTSAFDKNDKSQEAVSAQSAVLAKQIQLQYQEIGKLKQGLIQATAAFGETDTNTQKWQRSVNEATAELNKMKRQLSDLGSGAEDAGKNLREAGNDASFFKDALGADALVEGIKSIAGAISEISENTKEFRKITASLETSSQAAGYSAQQTAETFRQLYGVLGDDQTAATTTANLQAIGLSQEQLTQFTNAAIGAWAKYGDSIPIDGLSEAINETIKTSTVTGTFADVLNWAGQNEDAFNEKLAAAASETERANIVLQAMADQGLTQAGEAWRQNNEDLVAANQAQLEFQENAAKLAEQIAPAVNAVKDGVNQLFKALVDVTSGIDFQALASEIQAGFSYFVENILPTISEFVSFIIENKETVVAGIAGIGVAFATWNVASLIQGVVSEIQAFKKANEGATTAQYFLNAAMSANPIGIVVSLIAGLVAAITVLWATNEDFRKNVIATMEDIKNTAQKVVSAIVGFFTVTVPNALSTLLQKAVQIKNDVSNAFVNMRDSISNSIGRVRDSIVDGIQNAVSYITSLPRQAVTWGSDMIQGLANGVLQGLNSLLDAVRNVADRIRSYLHFSRPDTGPLRDYETWMPDMMEGMAKGIRQNAWQLEDALNAATSHMGVNVSAQMAGSSAGGINMGGVHITINPSPGMDVNALADAVAYRLQTLAGRKEAVW